MVGPGDTWGGRLSPDGRWLAYYSLESGYFEIYVTPFPKSRFTVAHCRGDRSVVVSEWIRDVLPEREPTDGGAYRKASGIRALSQRLVIEPFSPPLYDDYDIHPEGDARAGASRRRLTGTKSRVVLNWLADFRD